MGVRSSIELEVRLGAGNSLDEGAIIGEASLTQLLDTLAKARSMSGALATEEVRQIDLGDLESVKLIYVEAEGDLDLYLGGSAPTTAVVTAVGALFPMAFAGGEDLDLEIDGTAFTPEFESIDTSITNVINRINAAAAYAGISGLVASNVAGQIRLTSQDEGSASTVSVLGGTAAVLLGFTVPTEAVGIAPTADASPVRLRRLADPESSQVATLKVCALLTATTTSIHLSNPSDEDEVIYRVLVAGDLAPATTC